MNDNRLMSAGIVAAVVAIAGSLGCVALWDFVRIKGNEVGVRETWSGVDGNIIQPSTTICFTPSTVIYHYDVASQVFVMNDGGNSESGKGRDADSYLVQSKDQQDMHISLSVQWRLDPAKVIDIHKNYHAHTDNADQNIIEERLIRPYVMLIVKNHATKMNAIQAYSGEGLVQLQSEIQTDLVNSSSELRQQGVIVENFVIEKIVLDSKYVEQIKARQIAQMQQSRAVEETKAAEADALKAKAVAQADLNTQVVGAQRDKEIALLKAQQESEAKTIAAKAAKEQMVLAAEGDAQRTKIQADAERAAAEARAASIVALGTAKAEEQRLLFSAYSANGVENFVRIEASKNLAVAFSGIKGYLPHDMKINLLTGDFNDAINRMMLPSINSPK